MHLLAVVKQHLLFTYTHKKISYKQTSITVINHYCLHKATLQCKHAIFVTDYHTLVAFGSQDLCIYAYPIMMR